jgi:3-methyladenine DNA glycosylase AlkD
MPSRTSRAPDPNDRVKAARAFAALKAQADPAKAEFFPGFFKAGPGQYAEGDRFLGVVVPVVRQVARDFSAMPSAEVAKLLASPFNEARLLGLLILLRQYARATRANADAERVRIFRFFMRHRSAANNWNLVDSVAPGILGGELLRPKADRSIVYRLARSKNLWERRIAIIATFAWIRHDQFDDTLKVCDLLIRDPHDLIHKACGWMLREVGKRDELVLRDYLDLNAGRMPRTMLRYSIEKLAPRERAGYLDRKREIKARRP